jgi:large subunit ribosomal protein L24
MALRIKKDDLVEVIAGRDKGARGKVLSVNPSKNRALVEGVNMVKKHRRPRSQEDQGGIISVEAPIHMSNLMLIDPKLDVPTRFRTALDESGKKVRVSTKSGERL